MNMIYSKPFKAKPIASLHDLTLSRLLQKLAAATISNKLPLEINHSPRNNS